MAAAIQNKAKVILNRRAGQQPIEGLYDIAFGIAKPIDKQ
jgi:hypothetical protein